MKLLLTTFYGKAICYFNDFVKLRRESHTNKPGLCEFSVPINNPKINEQLLLPLNKISILYTDSAQNMHTVWSGFIRDIKPDMGKGTLNFVCIDFLWFCQEARFIREEKKYTNKNISYIIEDIISYLHNTYPLPFTLGTNNCNTKTTLTLSAGSSLLSCLTSITKEDPHCLFVIQDNKLHASTTIGTQLEGLRKRNVHDQQRANIIDWGREISLQNYFNAIISKSKSDPITTTQDQISINAHTLIEKRWYNPDLNNTNTKWTSTKYPRIKIDANKEQRRKLRVGDRKKVLLYSNFERLRSQYLWTIHSIKAQAKDGRIDVDMTIAEHFLDTETDQGKPSLDRILNKITTRITTLETSI